MFAELLRRKMKGIADLTAVQMGMLEAHYGLMVRWNKVMNLTRVENLEEAVELHYAESLFLAAHLPAESLKIADVGSGAGFPGFPVAVLRPDCSVTLIEAHRRKSVFLREVSRGVGNVRVLVCRAEDVDERFDRVISRAVSYEDLSGILKKLAPSADLLSGAGEPPAAMGIAWQEPIVLPWARGRYLRCGKASVSRETLPSVSRET